MSFLASKVRDSMLLVDVMFAQLSVLRASKIRNSGEGGKFVNLQEKVKPGDLITVRIEDIDTSKRRGAKGERPVMLRFGQRPLRCAYRF